ncbi:MAG: site-specific integrase [Desulfobulbaceae bacterium]|nr:site-specific integrase [Desulfobulbaceae bacterium]
MATIRKRGPYQWEVRIRKKGQPVQCKTFEVKKDAEDWAREIESEMSRGVFVSRREAENTTLAEALDRYSREITPQKKGFQQEQSRIEAWKRHPLSQRYLATLRGVDFARYRDDRLEAGKSQSTVRLELAIISHLFTVARKEWGMEVLSNPVQAIRLPATSKARDRRLQGDEEERLLAVCGSSRSVALKDIVILAIETAMRLGELLSLRWSEIDPQKRVARLLDTKNGESRCVPLSTRAVEALRHRPRSISDDRVFFEWNGAWSFESAWRRALKRANIEDLRFHDLRHEATSRFFEMGIFNPMEVSAITGHKDLKMLKRYTHLRAEDLAAKLG